MKNSALVSGSLVALLVLAPLGVRVLTWPVPRSPAVAHELAGVGKVLFSHEWTPHDPLCGGGDGLGPVYNAKSCVACHHQGGVGGSGGLAHNVTMFTMSAPANGTPRAGVVHAAATLGKYQETLQQLDPGLPAVARPALNQLRAFNASRGSLRLSQRNTPALFGAALIDALPDHAILAGERLQRLRWGGVTAVSEEVPVGRALRLADGRVGRFGWKAQSARLSDFVQAACANELGLSNPGQEQPRPLNQPDYPATKLDLTALQCDQLTAFTAALPRPVERLPDNAASHQQAIQGKKHFTQIGCTDCHAPQVGSVAGLYSDLLLHRMGAQLEGAGVYYGTPEPEASPSEGPLPDEWRTPPLWGVADSAPYLHDGRAATLEEAIRLHAGQAARAASRFLQLPPTEQTQVVQFLKSLRAP